jgi:hypothetical protein
MDQSVALHDLQLTDRLSYEEDGNIFFADFDGMAPNQVNPKIDRLGFLETLGGVTGVHPRHYRNSCRYLTGRVTHVPGRWWMRKRLGG